MKTSRLARPAADHPRAYVSNGLIGLRLGTNPLHGGQAVVGGFVGQSDRVSTESYVPAPYPLGVDVIVNRTSMRERLDLVRFLEQSYDLSCGELVTRLAFEVGEVCADVEVLTFCCRSIPTLVLQQVQVVVNRRCDLSLQAVLDPSGLRGRRKHRAWTRGAADAVLWWESEGGMSTCGVAFTAQLSGVSEDHVHVRRNDWGCEDDVQLKEFGLTAEPGRPVTLQQFGAMIPSILCADPHWQATRMLEVARHHGFDELRESNRAAWVELWRARPVLLNAPDRWQEMVDSAFFYLHTSIHSSMPTSVAPFGLSQHTYYQGHVFWDTETFMFPPALLTDPHSARAMLDYRWRCLDAARRNAAINGYRGLQFPWQSGNTGDEVTVLWGAGGIVEHHVTLDVAVAFIQYANATGDRRFLRERTWPVVEGVAEWLVSRFIRTPRGYEARHITGPDEQRQNHNVDNNAHFNILAITLLREAARLAKMLGHDPDPTWTILAQNIMLPIDDRTGIIVKHDRWRPDDPQSVFGAPEVTAAYLQGGYSHSDRVDRATMDYYLGRALEYAGQPMESGMLATLAARHGQRGLARQMIERGFIDRLAEPFDQWMEATRPTHEVFDATKPPSLNPPTTVFVTAAGSLLESILLGMPGLYLGPGESSSWQRWPVAMPEGCDGVEVERLWVRGCPARLLARHGDLAACIKFHDQQPHD